VVGGRFAVALPNTVTPVPVAGHRESALASLHNEYLFIHLFYYARRQHITQPSQLQTETRISAIAEGPRDASCQLKSCQLPCTQQCSNYLYDKSWTMKLKGYSGPMCNKHVHSTVTRSSRFHCLIGVMNKPTTVELCISPCIPTTCCGEIF